MPPVGVTVSLVTVMQKIPTQECVSRGPGQKPRMRAGSVEVLTASVAGTNAEPDTLMERVLAPANLRRAYQRVVSNKGAPGADGMTVAELAGHVNQYWPILKARLLAGEYRPQAVRAVEIPKPQGDTRQLGIPSVVDRLIQQALQQQLTPIFDPLFSDYSYGFRPGRSAHQAVEAARSHVEAGRRWCVELDLEKFFDRVNHDILMACIERRVEDKCVLKLIRRYLEAGIMSGGVASPRQEGTPQGGPLSPLLSNILLDELDRELERRDHRFVRYADDANIYVRSHRAGERVLASVERFLRERLKLTVNRKKSQVARAWKCDYLGYGMSWHQQPRLRVATMSLGRVRDRLRALLRSVRARKMATVIERINPVLRGWAGYFKLSQSKGPVVELDGWVRHKLRCVIWRQWKRPSTRARNLMRLGLGEERACKSAFNGRGPWWNSGAPHMNQALPKKLWDRLGLVSILDTINRLSRMT
ncbi:MULTISPECIES: group II intron reverse transcriptase/maturase [Pseudomonadaceae]|jgi:RNA-directed DNA polymerase|uniref:RNA-directed DNA polymerase n=6 Tax=Pseudomonas TaxID=286 RepID=A0A7Y7ZG86_PSEPU|nr:MULTISPECIES: group II intron reverse transcriptase/maturase [Pseudomonadaceae]PTC00552.1 group II intron reverse transcriptase/maturase [Thalassospira xiamenensis]MBA6092730.1 group II intron reverse transcriptase/maturase [Pseudomonas monteilii]MCZ9636536.1 group II intron reverse transcriptase/maturase [Pseudomonas putida]MCZ9636566.1 group II intron reverse transcriptase/maturase [Pseudomonas putida]MDH0185846.1 group II intron reverse transcriptase/maturase [Stutzerimonas stutzeri]